MSSWRDEYIQALHDRDEREKASYQRVDEELITAYTHLLERTAALEAEKAARPAPSSTDAKRNSIPPVVGNNDSLQLKSDLAEALRSNGQLQSRLKTADAELVKLRIKTKADTKSIEDLTRENAQLKRRAKDRGDEARGKSKLMDDLHDEVLSLTLQLNMSEQTVKKLKDENKELIDRWMASKRREAEEMNDTLDDQPTGR